MAIMFMKIDTNCDGTVDWVRERKEECVWGVGGWVGGLVGVNGRTEGCVGS